MSITMCVTETYRGALHGAQKRFTSTEWISVGSQTCKAHHRHDVAMRKHRRDDHYGSFFHTGLEFEFLTFSVSTTRGSRRRVVRSRLSEQMHHKKTFATTFNEKRFLCDTENLSKIKRKIDTNVHLRLIFWMLVRPQLRSGMLLLVGADDMHTVEEATVPTG